MVRGNTYKDEMFLEAIRKLEKKPGILPNTVDIANEVGCNRRTALKRLKILEESGEVFKIKAGRSHVWLIEKGDRRDLLEKAGITT